MVYPRAAFWLVTFLFAPILHLSAQDGHNLIGIGSDGASWGVIDQSPREVPSLRATNIVSISAQWGSLIIDSESRLWGVGAWCSSEPFADEPIMIAENVRSASCGENHCLFVKNDNTLWAIGSSWYGALGLGESVRTAEEPTQVASDVLSASAGGLHSLFVKIDNTLWGMGNATEGELRWAVQLGNAYTPLQIANNVTAAAAGWHQTLYITSDQVLCEVGASVRDWNSRLFEPRIVAEDVSSVSVGEGFTLFVKNDNTMWGVGSNNSGQLGIEDDIWIPNPVQIAEDVSTVNAGFDSTLFIKNDNTAWGMGDTESGKLGTISNVDINTPIFIGNGALTVAAGRSQCLILSDVSLTLDIDSDGFSFFNDPNDNNPFQPFIDEDGDFVPDNYSGDYDQRNYSPALENLVVSSDQFSASIILAPGTSYKVEQSSDLKNWLTTQIALSSSETDPSFSSKFPTTITNVNLGDSSLFYRLTATRE
ncbi:Regulator of chromosome condensation domain protein [Verrucomicrobiia bacterium DG1235]|nr:Regulator of chromosome condensation domain protein [Verrucomicrobiae bacterium DG1235]